MLRCRIGVANGPFPRPTLMLSPIEVFESHVAAAFAATTVDLDPFPHLVIDRLLPDEDYRRLQAAMPREEDWLDAGRQRWNWNIDTGTAPDHVRAIWHTMHQRIAPEVLVPALVDKLRPHLAAYWTGRGIDASTLEARYYCDEGRLLLRRPGYRLAPHLDPNHAAVTALLYLAREGDSDRYGTDLYRATMPQQYRGIFKADESGVEYELVRTVPYRPNTMLAFITPISLHGAEFPPSAEPFARVSYQFLVCLDKTTRKEIGKRLDRLARQAAGA
jgi:hypothetical protein